jgi:hypothetical protein
MSVDTHATVTGPGWSVQSRKAVGVVVLFGLLALVGLSAIAVPATGSTATVQNESSPPELHSAEKVNTTAVELLFVDDEGIDTESISPSEFLLSEGDTSRISVSATGTNATVTLVLAEPISSDELTVGLRSDSTIQDVTGTRVQTEGGAPTVTIPEMDGVGPAVLGTSVSDAIGGPAALEFNFDEELSELRVQISGPREQTLEIDDFETTQSNVYTTEYSPPESGTYTVTIERVTDDSQNTNTPNIARTFEASRASPEATIGLDGAASSGFSITFDAGQSRGERLTYTWEFDDGTTASGERVTHQFEPGRYNVTLTVRDEFGATGTDSLELNLTDGFGSDGSGDNTEATVRVVRGVSNTTLASIVDAPAGERVDITADDGNPLAEYDAVALDAIEIVPAVETSFSLALSGLPVGTVTGAADAETAPIGGFSVTTDLSETDITTVELTVSVATERLETRDITPENVTLRRAVDGEWTDLETVFVGESGGSYQYTATAPGFSRFGVVGEYNDSADEGGTNPPGDDDPSGDDDPPADTDSSDNGNTTSGIVLTNTTLSATEIQSGERLNVTGTAENQGNESVLFRPGLELDGEVVTVHDGLELGAGETEMLSLNTTLDETGTRRVSINGTTIGEVTVIEANTTANNTGNGTSDYEYNNDVFTVTAVNLSQTSIGVNETVRISGDVRNNGEEITNFLAEIMVDGEVVDTVEVPQVPPGTEIPLPSVEQRFEESGTYTINISGSEQSKELSVSQGGGGGLFSFLGFLPLGFLPLGIFRTILTFLGVPLLFLYLLLKAVAFYLGY